VNDKYKTEDLQADKHCAELDALKEKRVVFVDNTFFERPSGRITAVIEKAITDFGRFPDLINPLGTKTTDETTSAPVISETPETSSV
jgi:hypothetical protein